jgi:MaoC like domain
MSPSDETPRTGLPRYPVSLVRAVAPWKRSANAATVLPESQTVVTGWRPDREKLAAYRSLVGSSAEIPIAFPQLPIMALHIDLLSQWSFPVRALGLVHQGAVIEVLGKVPAEAPWDVRAAVSNGRHVRAGLEFDVSGEVSVEGSVRWRSTSIYLSRSRSASGAEESAVPQLDSSGAWTSEVAVPVAEGTGRAFGRVTGDINPIHLHALPAKVFGFPQAIAHGWWTTGRAAAELGIDEAVPGRRLEIAFRRPIVLPSTPILCSRSSASGGSGAPGGVGGVEFALFPVSPDVAADEPVRALVSGVVTG